MKNIDLTPELNKKITHWKVTGVSGNIKLVEIFNRKVCKKPITALKRFKKIWDMHNPTEITLTGLLVHAETKPINI